MFIGVVSYETDCGTAKLVFGYICHWAMLLKALKQLVKAELFSEVFLMASKMSLIKTNTESKSMETISIKPWKV